MRPAVFVSMLALLAGGATFAQTPAPYGLGAVPGDAEAILSWGWSPSDRVTGYSMRYGTAGALSAWTDIPNSSGTSGSYTVPNLTNGTRYYFQVRAVGPSGASEASNIATTRLAVSPGEAATINDDNLRRLLEVALGGHPPGATITQLELARMSGHFAATYREISDVTGMEHAVNLRELYLADNEIADLAPLSSLTVLTSLDLGGNAIADVAPLRGMTALTSLKLADNDIADVAPLRGLTSLTSLDISNNDVRDVAGLQRLTALRSLNLANNAVVDVAALRGFTRLTLLDLASNEVSDLAPLSGLAALTSLSLANNRVANVAPLGGLRTLASLTLSNNKITNVAPLRNLVELRSLQLANNTITDMEPLAGLTAVARLNVANNEVATLPALDRLTALTVLSLDGNQIVDVTPLASLTWLPELHLSNNKIENVSALGGMAGLSLLDLAGNAITDIEPLGGLTGLQSLYLANNNIADVASVSRLTELGVLDLAGNEIADLAPFDSLMLYDLHELHLSNNRITDLTPLRSIPVLASLYVANNKVADVAPLARQIHLRSLDLSNNRIADVSALGGLTGLSLLDLADNAITDIEPLGNLTDLESLCLANNGIADLAPVAWLSELRLLDLADNEITDISPLMEKPFPQAFRQESVVDLRGNPLAAASVEALVPRLRQLQGVAVLAGRQVPLFPAAADPTEREGFVRVLNRSDAAGDVHIEAVDDAGVRRGPLRLAIGAGGAAHFNSADLEEGNAAKGLQGGVGAPTAGSWRLELLSPTLDIEVLAYIRTPDGFLTSVHDVLPRDRLGRPHAAFFNPARNLAQASSLRLVNAGALARDPTIRADDDSGNWRSIDVGVIVNIHRRWFSFGGVNLLLVDSGIPAGATTLTAAALENTGLGAGVGKWRLAIDAPWWVDAMSLLASPNGHLANLSTAPTARPDGVWRVPFFPASSGTERQGFVRIANLGQAGEATVVAMDDGGVRAGPMTLKLGTRQTVHFNSRDLEVGNAVKGLSQGVGAPTRGDWRLEIVSESDIRATAFVRAAGGLLTSMHDVVPSNDNVHQVVFFNPGRNTRQVSLLRLANDGDAAARISVTGVDDAANPGGEVRATIPPGHSRTFTAAQMEEGANGLSGRLGTGQGKWRLRVASDRPLTVMSLLASPGGHLTNLSTRGDGATATDRGTQNVGAVRVAKSAAMR